MASRKNRPARKRVHKQTLAAAPQEPPPRWVTPAKAALIVLLAVGAYWPSIGGGYLWDDTAFIDRSPTRPTARLIQADDGLYRMWFTTEAVDYWPLANSAFWAQWRLWGMNPTGYRVTNIALHALGAVLLWLVLRRLRVPGAWLGALLFAVHPVGVASVAWISELKNCLSLPLCMAAALAWLRFEDSGHRRWYALSLVAFLLALTAKTSVVMLPVVLLGMAWWRRGRVGWRDVLRSAPFFAMSLAMGLVTIWFQHKGAIGEDIVQAEGILSRVAAAGWVVWFYLGKAFLPVRLSMVYLRWHVDPATLTAWLPLVALAAVTAVGWRWRRGWARPAVATLGYFVVMLVPVLGLVAMIFHQYSLVADHFQYLALPAATALVAAVVTRWGGVGPRRAVATGVAVVLVLACLGLTWQRATVFRTREGLWRDTIAKNPKATAAHTNLGNVLRRSGRFKEAMAHYEESLRLMSGQPGLHNNLGLALLGQGRIREAIAQYEKALRLEPGNAGIHNNLGLALQGLGRFREAAESYKAALQINPGHVVARVGLGDALHSLGRFEEAAVQYRAALRSSPNDLKALNNLAWMLATCPLDGIRNGREAVTLAGRAARLTRRNNFTFLDTLAAACAEAGDFMKAVQWQERAVQLAPQQQKETLRRRLDLYRAGKPFRETSPTGTEPRQ